MNTINFSGPGIKKWSGAYIVGGLLGLLLFATIPQSAKASTVAKGWEPMQKAVDKFFESTKKPHSTGGVVIVMHGGKRVFEGTYGAANREWDIPWETDTPFWTASVAKSYAAQIVLRLSDEGLVDLNAPVRDYIPEFPDYKTPVRVWHLLSMRSGLNEDSSSQSISGNSVASEDGPGMTKKEILKFIYSQPEPIFTPGRSKAHYENVAYSVIDHLIENVTGTHYADAVKKYITDPWGLKNTGSYKRNHFYGLGNKSATPYKFKRGQDVPNIDTEKPYTYLHANGIMYFTADDFAEWAKRSAYGVNGEKPMFERMINSPQLEGLNDTQYGFGIARKSHRGYDVFGHGGYFGNYYFWVPALDLVAVTITNEVGRYSYSGRCLAILDSAMKALNMEPASENEAERQYPGWKPLLKNLKQFQEPMLETLTGVFVNERFGHVIASYRTNEGIIRHSHNGGKLTFFREKLGDRELTAVGGGSERVKAIFVENGIQIKGAGYDEPQMFKRVKPKPASDAQKKAIAGIFYNPEWGSKYEIIYENGRLMLWNGDRSVRGKFPLKRITDEQWIAGLLPVGLFASVKFDISPNGDVNSFVLATSNIRNVRFERLVRASGR
ncbi:MAG: serine hydrolase domain-containing protein [Pseudomonadota bacterium]